MYEDLIDGFDPNNYNIPLILDALDMYYEAAGFDGYREKVLSKMSPEELSADYIEAFTPLQGYETEESLAEFDRAMKSIRLDLQVGEFSAVVTPRDDGERESVVAYLEQFKEQGGFGVSDKLVVSEESVEYASIDIGGLYLMETDPRVLEFVDKFEEAFASYAYTLTVSLCFEGGGDKDIDQRVWQSKAAKKLAREKKRAQKKAEQSVRIRRPMREATVGNRPVALKLHVDGRRYVERKVAGIANF